MGVFHLWLYIFVSHIVVGYFDEEGNLSYAQGDFQGMLCILPTSITFNRIAGFTKATINATSLYKHDRRKLV